uniref:Ubiquitin carboxyl-terminal hydrolase 37 n=1 Tax=Aceria tosichella TaxID=561515 RepID=A0A6G1S4K7_9ACAR
MMMAHTTNIFYPETPPKKSRLQDCNVKPPFSTFKGQLVDFDKKLSESIEDNAPAAAAIRAASPISQDLNLSVTSRCSGRESPLPLKNLGNTCYENSIIQCLFSLNLFMDNFSQSIESISNQTVDQSDARYRILNAFYNLYKSYIESFEPSKDEEHRQQRQQQLESRLEELKLAVGERSSQFNSAHQQDASEFFYHVIDSIQEYYQSLNKTDDHNNPVTQAFELELDYMARCPKCHHKVISESEKIRTLPLALPNINNNDSTSNTTNTPLDSQNEDHVSRIPTPPTSDLGLDSPKSIKETTHEEEGEGEGEEEKENHEQHGLEDEITTTVNENQCLENHQVVQPQPQDQQTQEQLPIPLPQPQQEQQQQQCEQQPRYTLSDALENYFKDDIIESKCSQPDCDSMQRTKKCLIRKLPQVLFITLARYSYSGKKSLDEIEAPFKLSVPFQENKSPSHSPSIHGEFGDSDYNYHLVAVVCHLGSSLDAGHYTSYVYNQSSASWYSCDDDSITKVREVDVRNDARRSGYCFFYAHKSSINVIESESSAEINGVMLSNCVVESSVVLTPESSPPPQTTSNQ